jgi:transcriptional regulator with XRE-family HTH domain
MKKFLLYTDREIEQKIGLAIKARRIKLELSKEELSHRSGVSIGTLTNLEKDSVKTSISLINLIAILRALNLVDRLEELLYEQYK